MQAFLPLKRSAASSTDKYADISEVQYAESKITRVTNIYIHVCNRQHGREQTTKCLIFFFPKRTDYIFLVF